tara:strand:+ start:476232 stop:476885 length:654 start_codon:yes stop_codon:yes gene_type:complete
MRKSKSLLWIMGMTFIGIALVAADHIDAPAVQGGTADITDYYAFQGENTDNLVFVANVQGLLSPNASSTASFNENVLVEINIDNNGDFVEDLVIQAIARNGKMYFFGPSAPVAPGLNSSILSASSQTGSVDITPYGSSAITSSNQGMQFFAGPRDDPFFFDFGQYSEIIAGNATSFNSPGSDTFAGTNVLSIVVEVPKTMLGGGDSLNTWIESKNKQ